MINAINLEILAKHLDKVPEKDFDMSWYAYDEHKDTLDVQQHECMTVGCALGYGPSAGLPVIETDRDWLSYSRRVFGLHIDQPEWDWCFSGVWEHRDNTPAGAAKRIRHLIEHGLPADAESQQWGEAPYIFAPVAA